MQIDMHYYGTYCLARSAGLTREAARIIATSAQFVDDNAQQTSITLNDGSSCDVCATAHHTLDISNIDQDDQRQVWVPFHFLPGNKGDEFTEKLICRKDSVIAQEMCANHVKQDDKEYFLPLVGVMAHVYGDTFAHYGFSGVSSRKNKLDSSTFEFQKDLDNDIKHYIVEKKERFFREHNPITANIKTNIKTKTTVAKTPSFLDCVKALIQSAWNVIQSDAAEKLSGALGHGAAVTFPDRPYLEWRFNYENGQDSGWHNNPQTFLEFSGKIHNHFKIIADNNPNLRDIKQYQKWDDLAPKIQSIIRLQNKKKERIAAWENAANSECFFNIPESIPEYEDWNQGFQELSSGDSSAAMRHPVYSFYQAASYHRWYVLRDLLPKHGLMVA